MKISVNTPAFDFTPMTKAFILGMVLGTCYGVMFAVFQGN